LEETNYYNKQQQQQKSIFFQAEPIALLG